MHAQQAMELLEEVRESLCYERILCDDTISKISIVGSGMIANPGVASKMFEALSEANINIQMFSTSEIKISVLIDEADSNRALNAVHDAFLV